MKKVTRDRVSSQSTKHLFNNLETFVQYNNFLLYMMQSDVFLINCYEIMPIGRDLAMEGPEDNFTFSRVSGSIPW